jgi:hypothetical protein
MLSRPQYDPAQAPMQVMQLAEPDATIIGNSTGAASWHSQLTAGDRRQADFSRFSSTCRYGQRRSASVSVGLSSE